MAKFNLRDYCRKNLTCAYRIKDAETEEAVTLRGMPAKFTVEALATHAAEHGIKSVKFPEEGLSGTKTGRASAGACSGEIAGNLVAGWLSAEEATPVAPSANGDRGGVKVVK